ncbi:hypothetical protein [Haploplasma modicum]|uniref:hypothetical protein n=1 Tax=Haploplasma modicum TaxID=2150 RepID=UPI00047E4CA8|nr:hypothetical protein [Haploplasma modicum]
MKKENLFLLVNTLILLLVSSLVLLSYLFIIPTSKIEKSLGQKVKFETVEIKNLPKTITEVSKVLNGKKEIGLLYKAEKDNTYGNIKLDVVLNKEGKIIGIASNIDQQFPGKNHPSEVNNYVNALKGSEIKNPGNSDIAKPTVSITLGTIDELLKDVGIAGGFIEEKSIYEILFGKNFSVANYKFKKTETVLEQKNVFVKGNKVARSFVINSVDDTGRAIKLNVVLNLENEILGYEVIEYGHGQGQYMEASIKFLDEITKLGLNINKVKDHETDITGATGSQAAIRAMFEDLNQFISNNYVSIYEVIFKSKNVGFERMPIIQTDEVLAFNELHIDNNHVGYSYLVSQEAEYFNGRSGHITFNIILDLDNKIIGYEEVEYKHTLALGQTNLYEISLKFLDEIVEQKLSIEEASLYSTDNTGATNTQSAIKLMFKNLNDFVVLNEKDIYEVIYGAEVTLEETALKNEYVSRNQNVLINGEVVGTTSRAAIKAIYLGQNTGVIDFEFMLNNNREIIGYVIYEYNHTEGSFKGKSIEFLDSLVKNKVVVDNILEYNSDITGATNSKNAIVKLLTELANLLGGK